MENPPTGVPPVFADKHTISDGDTVFKHNVFNSVVPALTRIRRRHLLRIVRKRRTSMSKLLTSSANHCSVHQAALAPLSGSDTVLAVEKMIINDLLLL